MTDYPDGTVAEVTYKGHRVRAARLGSGWQMLAPVEGYRTWTGGDGVTDIRPLLVIDPAAVSGTGNATDIAYCLRNNHDPATCRVIARLADQIEPPRIEEPGLWGVVEAKCPDSGTTRWHFIRDAKKSHASWTAIGVGSQFAWSDLIDPVLVREGVESDA